MQRNLTYQIYLNKILIIGFLFLYAFITPISPLFPPLIGAVAYLAYTTRTRLSLGVVLAFLLVFEALRGYPVFVSWGLFVVWAHVLIPQFSLNVICKHCIPFVAVVMFHGIYTLLLLLLGTLYNLDITIDPLFVVYYCLVDILIIFVAMRLRRWG